VTLKHNKVSLEQFCLAACSPVLEPTCTGGVCILDKADMVLPDDHKLVLAKVRNDPTLSVVEAKRALLSEALKACVGVHESKRLTHLGISEETFQEAGNSDDTPASFWVHDVLSDCFLIHVGIRDMSAKPSSTAVERVRN
jgi:hypothetical protein